MRTQVAGSLVSVEGTASGCRARFRFAGDLPVFAGHFPGEPLVPGVFLIEAVRLAAERQLGRPLAIGQVADARFSAPLFPEQEVVLELSFDEQARCIRCLAVARIGATVAGKFTLELVASLSPFDASK